jgi:methyltransferase-like protein
MGNSTLPPSEPNLYNQVLYPGFPFLQSHPDRLATQATLFGMEPAPLESCRVLEIGCGDGANLIPIAFGLPGSHCVGIDLAARPIANGQAAVEALGLRNITLSQMDIMDVTRGLGEFDYIIAHGIYSWVPPAAQTKLLAICSGNLAPNGVAYVSYNAYPGGHVREMIRRMMLYHTRSVAGPDQRVTEGLGMIRGLMEALNESDPFRQIIKPEVERMMRISPESLFHDDFAEFNTPVYFYEFIERAAQHSLAYVAEADFSAMHATQTSILEEATVPVSENVIENEQLLDFRIFRNFRATLLCHRGVRVDRVPEPARTHSLFVASPTLPESPHPDIPSGKGETFYTADRKVKLKVTTNHPLTKAALLCLSSRWPQRIPFRELEAAAFEASHWKPEGEAALPLEKMLLKMYAGKLVDLHAHKPAVAREAGERPVASPLARFMARNRNYVTNLIHDGMHVDNTLRNLIQLLDGTRDRAALLREMQSRIASGELAAEAGDQPVKDVAQAQKILADGLEDNLRKVARMALLVA